MVAIKRDENQALKRFRQHQFNYSRLGVHLMFIAVLVAIMHGKQQYQQSHGYISPSASITLNA